MLHTVLAVCQGNICRSPVVERILPTMLDGSITVTSAGTQAMVGRPIDPPMATLLARDGYPTTGFAATQLNSMVIAQATIVLTMTTEQRDDVVALVPSSANRTFTLLELAHVLRSVPPPRLDLADDDARWAAIVDTVAGARHRPVANLDIPDPYGGTQQRYDRAYATILSALTHITRATSMGNISRWDPRQAMWDARAATPHQPKAGPRYPRHARR